MLRFNLRSVPYLITETIKQTDHIKYEVNSMSRKNTIHTVTILDIGLGAGSCEDFEYMKEYPNTWLKYALNCLV